MSTYERPWPAWSQKETILFVYLHSRGFELPDVARIMECKLHRPARSAAAFHNHMERINLSQVRRGRPRLCEHGMADWNRAAVDNFLIHSTDDSDMLEDLLSFHPEYRSLLWTWIDHGIPMREVLNVGHLQTSLNWLIHMHRSIYGYLSHRGWRYYR